MVEGFDGVASTNTAEVFCPVTGRWSMISPMRMAKSGVKVVLWSALSEMMVPRYNCSLPVVQRRLVVICGYQGTETPAMWRCWTCPPTPGRRWGRCLPAGPPCPVGWSPSIARWKS